MNRKLKFVVFASFLLLFFLLGVLSLHLDSEVSSDLTCAERAKTNALHEVVAQSTDSKREGESAGIERAADDVADGEDAPVLTPEEKIAAEEERLVEVFDGLTDKWMEPAKKGVSLSDIDQFAEKFRQVPLARKEECLHRALNLIPDENVMLLAGILMDKSMDKEYVELVYNDVLNRDEEVKKPILQEIFKDKTHSCWADTAWILDVTGELPKKE